MIAAGDDFTGKAGSARNHSLLILAFLRHEATLAIRENAEQCLRTASNGVMARATDVVAVEQRRPKVDEAFNPVPEKRHRAAMPRGAEDSRADAYDYAEAQAAAAQSAVEAYTDSDFMRVYNVQAHGAVGDGAHDDTTAIQAAMDAAGPTGEVVFFPAGTYKISSPLLRDKSPATSAIRCPALVGAPGRGGKSTDSGGDASISAILCSDTFPAGEFAIDYIGAQNAALIAPHVAGLQIMCSSRAAGIRCVNQNGGIWERIDMYHAAIPAPANNVGTPTGAFNFLNSGNSCLAVFTQRQRWPGSTSLAG